MVIDGVTKLLAAKAHTKVLGLAVVIQPDVPHSLVGDPGRLQQILPNLLGNTIQFTEKGEVNLFVRLQNNDAGASDIEFAVQDIGIGLSTHQLNMLFHAFTQVDSTASRSCGGTGLGLVICKRLVELMGGDIRVESRPRAGSTFIFGFRCG